MTAVVEVVTVRPIGRGQLQAVATIRLGPVLIHGVRVLQQDDGPAWVGLPQVPIRKGGTGWTAAVAITDPDVLAELRELVLAAWREQAERGTRAGR